ncbi:YolD-like family protein [Lacrimispora celerecrescens]|uniref:YolD-like family protein n=1 Tax=Lacrimispora celerecrescens TaxID=29354 RepID=UPI00164925A4|nr:YolD-like family protein [Lacrimispora celerecrescens]
MTKAYDDIIHLPRHVSATHPHMAVIDRAAQFSPFAALTGYDAAMKETERLTDVRVELDESMKDTLSNKLQIIADRLKEQPEIAITYFQPDGKKNGGAYVTAVSTAKKIDKYERVVVMSDGIVIPIDEIISIDGQIFENIVFHSSDE